MSTSSTKDLQTIKETVQERYGQAARRVLDAAPDDAWCGSSCCGGSAFNGSVDPIAVSDVVVRGEVPAAVRRSMELWVGCVAGELEETEFKTLLASVGFVDADVEPTRIYKSEDARAFLNDAGVDVDANLDEIDGRFMAAFVRASKPS